MKYILPLLLMLVATPALAQDVSSTSKDVVVAKPEPEPIPQYLEDWPRKAMNEQTDATLYNISNHCSGTLISAKYRLIITNYHCVDDLFQDVEEDVVDPDTGEVKKVKKRKKIPLDVFQSNDPDVSTKFRAEIEGYSRKDDLALLKVKSFKLNSTKEVKLAPAGWCERGMPAWAVGNPLMLEASVTKGIVSYCERLISEESQIDPGEKRIQFDTPIAGGSSGGGLFNYHGELIGVTNSGYRGADMSFAVPVEKVKELLKAEGYASVYDSSAPDKAAADKKKEEEKKAKENSYGRYGPH